MSLSDLDYVNAAVSRSEQQPQPPRAGGSLGSASAPTSTSIESVERTNGAEGAALNDDDDEDVMPSGARAGVPSLAALLASLESVTIDAQRLGVSSSSTTALFASSDRPLSARGPSQLPDQNGHDGEEEEEEEDLDPDSLRQLLAKLDETEGAADDLEGRLDGLIDNLDKLLGALGGGGGGAAAPSSFIDGATSSDE
ncbi:hypothetical protein B0A53_06314 [Rhodotorula sp. CCFEE 5036]|jgi:hypothetical protein|nr:hypothetical protein B0A53_06314 [Rhodotorula sp. CCFEE 5036]